MKKNPYKSELSFGLIFTILATITGAITGFWAWSFFLWSMVYIFWKWLEMYHFYEWYNAGASLDKVPLNFGIWEDFCSLIIRNINKNSKLLKKNKLLIKQFETTAQALPYATVLLNQKFEIEWANNASLYILGIIHDQDKGSKIDNIIRNPIFIKLLEDEEKIREIKINHPNEQHRRIHIKLVKLSNKRYLLVARDISEQESLRKSRKAFVANASHELRTPLTVIAGYLEMLHNSGEISQQWLGAIEQAMQQSTRMESIINDMLKLSSIEKERYLEENDDAIDMPALINRLFNDVRNSSKAKRHQFIANIDSELSIKGNEKEIISICLNLLNNAVIHTKEGTEISIRWFKQSEKAQLWICDNGEGIEKKHLTHLTERFYRVDNSRDKNTNSTGLGLAIVKQICDNHESSLIIESERGSGACFKIEFPSTRTIKLIG